MTLSDRYRPTFGSRWDYAVYLLGEYKVPITLSVLAVSVWAAWAVETVPSPPPELLNFAAPVAILAIPAYAVGDRLAKWLDPHEWVKVGVADPGTVDGDNFEHSTYDGKGVAPDLWEQKTVTGYRPLRPDDGTFDAVVTAFEYYDDIEELEVRGCEQAELEPSEAWESATRVDEIYEHHHRVKRAYSQLKSTVHSYATQVHDATLLLAAAEDEKANVAPEVEIQELIDEMEREVEDLPEAPAPDDEGQWLREAKGDLGDLDPLDDHDQMTDAVADGGENP
ncbi:hypothetical protein SAMN05192554_1352 [Haloarchaeobius iranensis]|uniref:Uncharacterized protein n=1 Tax=Haloarchaeobius iranensis TaxID=996166 RepID=A0A1H0B7V6_9EURY|nr:hypothetical protein SAMN05192554_1352 [Haloarchaeobius iranensis]